MVLWMRVTNDKYQLPIMVEQTAKELALKCGVSEDIVRAGYSNYKLGRLKNPKYIRVEVDDEQ